MSFTVPLPLVVRPARLGADPRTIARRLGTAVLWLAFLAVGYLALPTQLGGVTGYTIVCGHSMDPTFHTGDLLITRRQDHYRVGQVVVYRVPDDEPGAGFHVVHRIVAGSGKPGAPGWTTKGDNNPAADIWTPHDSDIQGAVLANLGKTSIVLRQARDPLLYCLLGAIAVGRILWPRRPAETTAQPDKWSVVPAGGQNTPLEGEEALSGPRRAGR